MPWTEAIGTCICSKRRVTKMPSSSAVRSRSAASRQLCARRSPSKTPMVTFVLPTSKARSILRFYGSTVLPPAHFADTMRCRPPAVRASSAPSSASPAVVPDAAPDGPSHSIGAPCAEGDNASHRATSGGGPAVCELAERAVERRQDLGQHLPRVRRAPQLGLDGAGAIGELRRKRRGPQVDPDAEHDVTQALGTGRGLGEDPGDLTPRAKPRAADRDDVVGPLDLRAAAPSPRECRRPPRPRPPA